MDKSWVEKHPEAAGLPGAHDWEMVTGFVLSLGIEKTGADDCLLAPLYKALVPVGLSEAELCEISSAVEKTGEEMRGMCPEGKLHCINVRVFITHVMDRKGKAQDQPVKYFLNRVIASSESDNLDAMSDPCCYIELYLYQ